MYDYTIKSELENGQVKTISYQKMLLMVDMQNEIMHGAKLSEGGLPQVISFISLIKPMVTGVKKITVFYEGEAVASV
jgi:hypothetical protein